MRPMWKWSGAGAAFVAAAVLLAGCQNATESSNTTSNNAPPPTGAVKNEPPAGGTESTGAGTTTTTEKPGDPMADAVKVEILTASGRIVLDVYPHAVKSHADNFIKLVNEKFFDGLTWHRVVAGFVIQSGDPTAGGSGGPGYDLPMETSPLKHDREGRLAMAQSPGHVSGSQFYITMAPTPTLDPPTQNFAPFGQVVEGMDIVKKVKQGEKIKSMKVIASGGAAASGPGISGHGTAPGAKSGGTGGK